jgi:prepilin-type N-terminal cleavage/methylation domain-containing protein
MNFKKKLKGFSLVELLVSMAIIAVLLGLVGFGIATAQRSARDNQRQQKLSDIQLALEDFQIRKNRYPEPQTEFQLGSDQLVLTVSGGNDITVQFDGPTRAQTEAQGTTAEGSVYCYQKADGGGGYLLGVKLENGEWFDKSSTLGQSNATCQTVFTPNSGT